MTRCTRFNLNPFELSYYPFIARLGKCSPSCNAFDDLSTKICVVGETKDVTLKLVNMITSIVEIKTFAKHILCHWKCKFDSIKFNLNQKWNNLTCECKNYCPCKNNASWNSSTCTYKNEKSLKSIADILVIVCDKIKIDVPYIVHQLV